MGHTKSDRVINFPKKYVKAFVSNTYTHDFLSQARYRREVRASKGFPSAESMPCVELKEPLKKCCQTWVKGHAFVALRGQYLD